MSITWNTGSAAERFRHNLKLKAKNKKSYKPQATSHKKQPQLKDKIKL
jgi:hypothetical protein